MKKQIETILNRMSAHPEVKMHVTIYQIAHAHFINPVFNLDQLEDKLVIESPDTMHNIFIPYDSIKEVEADSINDAVKRGMLFVDIWVK